MNMNPMPELASQLKLLRLSGILDSLEARNRQAIDGKLPYTEFLAMLIGISALYVFATELAKVGFYRRAS